MKWYFVKEHQPVLSICCVLLAVRDKESGNIFLCLGEWDSGSYRDWETDRKSTRLNSSHITRSRMPSSA